MSRFAAFDSRLCKQKSEALSKADESVGVRAFLARGQPMSITRAMLELGLVILLCIFLVLFIDFVNFTAVSWLQTPPCPW